MEFSSSDIYPLASAFDQKSIDQTIVNFPNPIFPEEILAIRSMVFKFLRNKNSGH